MRFIKITLYLLLLTNSSYAFNKYYDFPIDSVSHVVKKNYAKNRELSFRAARERHKKYFDDCIFVKKYSLAQRLKRYPYSKAVKIVAVSYNDEEPKSELKFVGDTAYANNSNKKNDTLFNAGLHIN